MNDLPTTVYPQPALRISATFPASDGTSPESIDVEFGTGVVVDGNLVREVISALAAVPDHRYAISRVPVNAAEARQK